jgi:hypothetical protein
MEGQLQFGAGGGHGIILLLVIAGSGRGIIRRHGAAGSAKYDD